MPCEKHGPRASVTTKTSAFGLGFCLLSPSGHVFRVGLCSGRQICRGEIFQTCLKDLSPTDCRLSVVYMSVLCWFCRGALGDVSVLIRPPMVDGLSVTDRLCIGHMSVDLTPIQDRVKSDITPNCVESADTFPNQNRRVPDISRTQTECKPMTVCGIIPTYKKHTKQSGKYLFTKVLP